ncbi:MAG TPA: NAD(P)-dependent oxidoreductase [Chloroflexota bacterium]|jgi:D-3-phosphoglycerate dehydrogenase|nr:NAD(P)-dependent oxidoreductase [Chloroflexota bacterium]
MKVVVTGLMGTQADYEPIREAGHDLIFALPSGPGRGAPLTDAELIEICRDADGILSMSLSGEVMASAPNLRAVVASAIGYEKIDVESATNLGILVCNSPTAENFVSVSESTVLLALALLKRLKRKEARIRNGEWGQVSDRGHLLWKKTVGLIGLGRTGSGVAQRLAGWDVEVIAYDPYLPEGRARELGVRLVDLDTLLSQSDVVSLHVVVTPETRGMIGEAQLRRMKPTAYLINTSRGEAIDEDALTRAIQEEWIAGAALDTFDTEPLALDSSLRDLDPERVLLTPHNVAHTMASLHANRALAIQSLLTVLKGEVPSTVVNPAAVDSWKTRFAAAHSPSGE